MEEVDNKMRTIRYLLVLLMTAAIVPCTLAAGVAVGVIGGGGTGSSEPVAVGSEQTIVASVANGASSVQFIVYDSRGNEVFASSPMPVIDGSVSTVWSPPFADTFTVWAVSYDEYGGEIDRGQVLLVSAYQPESQGFITGGGWLEIDGNKRTFGFVAQVQRNGSLKGSLEYQRHGLGFNVKSYAIDWVYAPNLSEGYFSGWATINGEGIYRFYAMVLDSGEPGRSDYFALWVYNADGMLVFADWGYLSGGNIMIHANR